MAPLGQTILMAAMVGGLLLIGGHAPARAAACTAGFLSGADALASDWSQDRPGLCRQILPGDLPPPTESRRNPPEVVPRPEGAWPQVPPGFAVREYFRHPERPRQLRAAPNGDIFVAESYGGAIRVIRPAGVCRAGSSTLFAEGLQLPFGMAFYPPGYPPGPNPQYLYVAGHDRVVRYPYANGTLVASAAPEAVARLPAGAGDLPGQGHWTRDIVFSPDDAFMFVSVGSYSNAMENGEDETARAAVIVFRPDGTPIGLYAWGLRNPVALAVSPATGAVWATVNERDGMGDHLVPDFVTALQPGRFYGWPWFYLGVNPDPRHLYADPAQFPPIAMPDVLLQAHTASLGAAFYTGGQFPPEYRGSLFVAAHGSWNRSEPLGAKVIGLVFDANGRVQPYYEDFMTGFNLPEGRVWGRPVGVTGGVGGSLYVSEDANDTTWCVARADLLAP
jgi:glucose/arabinose dehydrogenase